MKLLLILKYYTMPLKWLKLGDSQETLGQPCMQLGWRIQHSSFLNTFPDGSIFLQLFKLHTFTAQEFNKFFARLRYAL